jgi:hypothetical protein
MSLVLMLPTITNYGCCNGNMSELGQSQGNELDHRMINMSLNGTKEEMHINKT